MWCLSGDCPYSTGNCQLFRTRTIPWPFVIIFWPGKSPNKKNCSQVKRLVIDSLVTWSCSTVWTRWQVVKPAVFTGSQHGSPPSAGYTQLRLADGLDSGHHHLVRRTERCIVFLLFLRGHCRLCRTRSNQRNDQLLKFVSKRWRMKKKEWNDRQMTTYSLSSSFLFSYHFLDASTGSNWHRESSFGAC